MLQKRNITSLSESPSTESDSTAGSIHEKVKKRPLYRIVEKYNNPPKFSAFQILKIVYLLFPILLTLFFLALPRYCYNTTGISGLVCERILLPSFLPPRPVWSPDTQARKPDIAEWEGMTAASRRLMRHNESFEKRLVAVANRLWVAVGYGLSNVVIWETEEGLVFIDSGDSTVAMREILKSWEGVIANNKTSTHLPRVVRAVVISHHHADHLLGLPTLMDWSDGPKSSIDIIGHEASVLAMRAVLKECSGATFRGAQRQFGQLIGDDPLFAGAGIGPQLLSYLDPVPAAPPLPNIVWEGDTREFLFGTLQLTLMHLPGESSDQVLVWNPTSRILFAADNVYSSWPNLYAIRGSQSRDPAPWIHSLDQAIALRPEILLMGHAFPLEGDRLIAETLLAYRDALQYVRDQTLRLLNRGVPVADIPAAVRLPPPLASHPYLQEFYGRVEWAVRGIVTHYLGWFTGAPQELYAPEKGARARNIVELAGGVHSILAVAVEAEKRGDVGWSLELGAAAFETEPVIAREQYASILRKAAERESAASGRNWLLTLAAEVEGRVTVVLGHAQKLMGMRQLTSAFDLIDIMRLRINSDYWAIEELAVFDLGEEGKRCLHLRRGVLDVYEAEETGDGSICLNRYTESRITVPLEIHTNSKVWLGLGTEDIGFVKAFATGGLATNSISRFLSFLSVFDLDTR